MNVPGSVTDQLAACGLDPADVAALLDRALAEDLGDGTDVTTVATVPVGHTSTAEVVARTHGVIAGLVVATAVFTMLDHDVAVEQRAADGDRVQAGDVVLSVSGPTRGLLTAERTALNVLSHLSGIASETARWVDAVAGTKASILDTRKTTPGLRALEKYAVRCGGGGGFRMGLYDAAMVKDNHVLAAGGVAAAYRAVRAAYPDVRVEVECDSLTQVEEALSAGADLLLLDNMTLDELRSAVAITAGRARLDASGGLTLDRAPEVAETGVDYLSVGALTHSAAILDLGFDLRTESGD